VDVLVQGALTSAVIALVALGFSLVYGVGGIVNLAHGSFFMLGAYSAYAMTQRGAPLLVAAVVGVLAAMVAGVLLERLVIAPIRHQEVAVLISTLAVAILVQSGVQFFYGGLERQLPGFVSGRVEVLGVGLQQTRVLAGLVALVAVVAVLLVLSKTPAGRMVRAVAEDEEASRLIGVRPERVTLYVLAIGAGLAGLAGVLTAPVRRAHADHVAAAPDAGLRDRHPRRARQHPGHGPGRRGGRLPRPLRRLQRRGRRHQGRPGDGRGHPRHAGPATAGLPREGRAMTSAKVAPAAPQAGPAGGAGSPLRRLLRPNLVLLVLLPLLLLYLPRLVDNTTLLQAFAVATIFVMFAASWDILSGYTGQVNFGHAAFIGTGAYTVALLSKYSPDTSNELALLAAVGTAALLGLAIGIPCLRLKGPYLALATLSVAGALVQLTFIFKTQTGGEDGIAGVKSVVDGGVTNAIGTNLAELVLGPLTFASLGGFDQYIYVSYFAALVAMVVMVGGLLALGYGKRGLVLRSIQQDELAAEAAGVPLTRYKLAAFVLSAACAGFAGGLYAQIRGTVALDLLSVDLSLLIIIIAAFGGAGSIIGPALGAYVVVLLQNYYLDRAATVFAEHPEIKIGAFALLLIVVLIVQPRGLVPPLLQRLSGRGSASGAAGATMVEHGGAQP
jgi:branched-chain amino acid transport system permease protein